MPYKVQGNAVYVKRGAVWKVLKRHKTKKQALDHFKALMVNVIKQGGYK